MAVRTIDAYLSQTCVQGYAENIGQCELQNYRRLALAQAVSNMTDICHVADSSPISLATAAFFPGQSWANALSVNFSIFQMRSVSILLQGFVSFADFY